MKNKQKGQISTIAAIIGAVGMIVASGLTALATANSRVAQVDAKVDVVTERENNHYEEVQKNLTRIESKLDKALEAKTSITANSTK